MVGGGHKVDHCMGAGGNGSRAAVNLQLWRAFDGRNATRSGASTHHLSEQVVPIFQVDIGVATVLQLHRPCLPSSDARLRGLVLLLQFLVFRHLLGGRGRVDCASWVVRESVGHTSEVGRRGGGRGIRERRVVEVEKREK